jgi:hypothetical protein
VTYLKIPIPALDAGLVSNLLWGLGALLLVISPGGLTHNWWWSVLAAGGALVATGALLGVQADEAAGREKGRHLRATG